MGARAVRCPDFWPQHRSTRPRPVKGRSANSRPLGCVHAPPAGRPQPCRRTPATARLRVGPPPECPLFSAGLLGERDVAEWHQRLAAQDARQVLPGRRGGSRRDRLRRPGNDDLAAAVASLRAQIHDPVGRLDHVQIVLDDQDRVAAVDQPVEDLQELLDVREVEAGRWLVEDVEGAAGGPPREFSRELDPLRLAARQGRRPLRASAHSRYRSPRSRPPCTAAASSAPWRGHS